MRILIVRLSSLGDVVHTIPVAAALRRSLPDARIDWLVDSRHSELVGLVPSVDHCIVLPTDRGVLWLPRLVRELRAPSYDVAIDLQGLMKSAALARSSGASRVIGFESRHLRERSAHWLYTETPTVGSFTHVIRKNLALVSSLNVDTRALEFPILNIKSNAVGLTRAALGGDVMEPFVLLNPGSAWESKCWSPVRFGQLAQSLWRIHGMRSAVLWGPSEKARAQSVVTASAGSAVLTPLTTISDLVALARAATVMVSGDTGPLHIAAAVNTPCVGIYGPSDPIRNGPWSEDDVVVSKFDQCGCQRNRGGSSGVIIRRCLQKSSCMSAISVDAVARAVLDRLSCLNDAQP